MKRLLPNLLLLAAPALSQNLLFNAGAELGSTSGWADPTGNGFDVNATTVYAGGFSFHGGAFGSAGAHESRLAQVVDLSPWAVQIDAGGSTLPFVGAVRSNEFGGWTDWGTVVLDVLDGSGGVLATASTGQVGPVNTWNVVELTPALPAGARAVRITLIATRGIGSSTDAFFDELECLPPAPPLGAPFCLGEVCPCGNDDPLAGCANTLGSGGHLFAAGSASVTTDDLAFTAHGVPTGAWSILVVGDTTSPGSTLADGLLCLSGSLIRLQTAQADAFGTIDFGAGHGVLGGWVSGEQRSFQAWYRDTPGPCGGGSNLTHGVTVMFVP